MPGKPHPPVAKPATPGARPDDPLYIGSLEKGMRVLEAFESDYASLGLTEIANITGLGKSATQRLTHTWEALGYLRKDPRTRRYSLTPRIMALGHFFLRNDELVARAAPHLVRLRERCGLAVNLSGLADTEMVYLLRLPSNELTLAEMLPGRRMPAWVNSAGRILLAQHDDEQIRDTLSRSSLRIYTSQTQTDPQELLKIIQQARTDGYAIASEQVLAHQIGAAVLVHRPGWATMAAISATASLSDVSAEQMREQIVPKLMDTARAILQS